MGSARGRAPAGLLVLLALFAAGCSGSSDGEWISGTTTTAGTAFGSPDGDWIVAATTTTTTTSSTSTTTTSTTTTTAPTVGAVRVAPDGSGDAPDLATALTMVQSGGTILLAAGEHILAGPVLIDRAVTIRGDGSAQTTVAGAEPPELLRFTGPGTLTLEGIAFRYAGTEGANCLVVEGGTVSFTNVAFTGAVATEDVEGTGLLVRGDTTGTISGALAQGNQGPGFEFRGTADVDISGSTASANDSSGFAWAGQAAGTARANTARTNGFSGFVVLNRARPTLTDNEAEENGDDGFLFKGASRVTLAGNRAVANSWAGFRWVEQASGTAQANTAQGNSDGFWVADQADPTLVGNTSRGHHRDSANGSGLVYSGTAGGAARGNEIFDNDWGIALGTEAAPTLTDNDVHDNTSNRVTGVTFG